MNTPDRDYTGKALAIARGLYPHQVEGVAFLMRRRRAILADDMGLGKTRQAIGGSDPRYDERAVSGSLSGFCKAQLGS